MIKNMCDTCRNCFQDCQSDPIFITEEEAQVEGVPADFVKECDCYVPEDLGSPLVSDDEEEEYAEDDDDNDDDDDDDDDDSWLDDDDCSDSLEDDDWEGDEDLAKRDSTWDD